MKTKPLIVFLILLVGLSTLTYAFNLKTYVIQDAKPKSKYKTFNICQKSKIFEHAQKYNVFLTYEKPSQKEELIIAHKKTEKIRAMRYKRQQYMENKERHLKDISKNWFCFKDGKYYYGYDEDIHGSKELYLHWKD